MVKVRIEILPSLADALGMGGITEEWITPDRIAEGYTVKDLLNKLQEKYPRFGELVFDRETQKLTGQVVIFLNNRSLDLLEGLETHLAGGETVTFIPFVEGG